MRILREKDKLERQIFLDQVTRTRYQRVVGGIGWPGDKPGFAVVLGEEAAYRPPYRAYLVEEVEADSLGELLRLCLELRADCNVQDFYGLSTDKASMEFLSRFNKEQRDRGRPPLYISPAPQSDSGRIAYHINTLLARLNASEKTLFLTPESKLPGYLLEVQASEMHKTKAHEHPAVAALAFAVSALNVWEPAQDFRESENNENDWSPFDGVLRRR